MVVSDLPTGCFGDESAIKEGQDSAAAAAAAATTARRRRRRRRRLAHLDLRDVPALWRSTEI